MEALRREKGIFLPIERGRQNTAITGFLRSFDARLPRLTLFPGNDMI